MKHGRRHDRLKEKAYLDRKDAEGYGRPYRPLPLDSDDAPLRPPAPPPEAPPATLGLALGRRAKRDLKRQGIDPDADDP